MPFYFHLEEKSITARDSIRHDRFHFNDITVKETLCEKVIPIQRKGIFKLGFTP